MEIDLHILFQRILDNYGPNNFEALADHPTQAALGLKAITVDLAHLVCTYDQRVSANSGRWDSILFAAQQERDFALLQIQLNTYLDSVTIPRQPLLHLSPRMLLDKPQANENQDVNIKESAIDSKTRKKRRKNNKKGSNVPSTQGDRKKTASGEQASVYVIPEDSMNDAVSRCCISTTACVSSVRYDYTIPKDTYSAICSNLHHESDKKCVDLTCEAYEEILLRIREQHDTILQSLNMRLFIAQTEIENLKDSLQLRTQIEALS